MKTFIFNVKVALDYTNDHDFEHGRCRDCGMSQVDDFENTPCKISGPSTIKKVVTMANTPEEAQDAIRKQFGAVYIITSINQWASIDGPGPVVQVY